MEELAPEIIEKIKHDLLEKSRKFVRSGGVIVSNSFRYIRKNTDDEYEVDVVENKADLLDLLIMGRECSNSFQGCLQKIYGITTEQSYLIFDELIYSLGIVYQIYCCGEIIVIMKILIQV